MLRGAFGYQKINTYRLFHENTEGFYNIVKTTYFDSKLKYSTFSDRFVEKAGFIKLDNISVRYHVPSPLKITITGTVQNLFTITKYTGMDPEVAYEDPILRGQVDHYNSSPLISGVESRGGYLPSRIFSLGIGINL
jgi:iron complex outermembrane receptor protein